MVASFVLSIVPVFYLDGLCVLHQRTAFTAVDP